MKVQEALAQISEIHAHLAKGEIYQGLRAEAVAGSGLVGLLTAGLQMLFWTTADAWSFAGLWIAAACLGALVGCGEAAYHFVLRDDLITRRRTLRVVGQFAPCVAVGMLTTVAVLRGSSEGEGTLLLPGVWTMLYGLGLFSARPYLPRAAGWVALFYLLAGGMLALVPHASLLSAGAMLGGTFALGQCGLAWVFHRNEARNADAHA